MFSAQQPHALTSFYPTQEDQFHPESGKTETQLLLWSPPPIHCHILPSICTRNPVISRTFLPSQLPNSKGAEIEGEVEGVDEEGVGGGWLRVGWRSLGEGNTMRLCEGEGRREGMKTYD